MLFVKPNIKYTDMCIYVDSIIERGNPSEQELNTCFEYIYHIGFMLAHKHKFFNKGFYYEEFALFLATDIMHRLFFNPKLQEIGEDGKPLLPKIKSILNYIKAILYGRKVEFEQQNYSQQLIKCEDLNLFSSSYNENLYNSLKETDIKLYFVTLPKTIKHIVYSKNYYKYNKILMKNIYISCLLTVLNSFTLTKVDLEKLYTTYSSVDSKYRLLSRLYQKNREDSVTLYHLDSSYKDYIKLLSNKIYKQIKDDLLDLSNQSFSLSDDALINAMYLEINGKDFDNE